MGPTEHALYALHECRPWEEVAELGCSVVGWLYTILACAGVCHTVHVWVSMNTVPLYHWPSLLHICACPLHVAILSVCPHTIFQFPLTLTLWWIPLCPVSG